MRALADRIAQRAGEGKGPGGKGGNARPEGDRRVSCRIRLLAFLTLEFFLIFFKVTFSEERDGSEQPQLVYHISSLRGSDCGVGSICLTLCQV
jgi:hypothetical protein